MDQGLVAWMEMKDFEHSVPAPTLRADSYFLLQLIPFLTLAWCSVLLLSEAARLPSLTPCSLCGSVRRQPPGLGSIGELSGLEGYS